MDNQEYARALLSQASGQVHALSLHDKWIVGHGDASHTELIERKLQTMNTTSGEFESLVVPTRNTLIPVAGGERLVPESLFPGYFLIGVNSPSPHWQDMMTVKEVYSILNVRTENSGRRVVFLNPEEIGRIVEMIQEIPHRTLADDFSVGEPVIVTDGAFKGLGGRIVEIRGRSKAKVEIEVRGKTFPTEFQLTSLRPRRGRDARSHRGEEASDVSGRALKPAPLPSPDSSENP